MIGYGNSYFTTRIIDSGGAPPSAPVNTVAPAISGTTQEYQTLSCSTGTWTGNPTPTYTYQWYRGASAIGSATNSTYTLVAADVGQNIKCTVTATNIAGSASADSNTVVPVAYNQYSLLFDGVDEYAKGSTTFSELDGTNKFTLSMWIKPTNLTTSRILFHIPRNTTSSNSQVLVWLRNTGQLDISISSTGSFMRSNTGVITAGNWHHILLCFDLAQATSAQRIRPFVDGVDVYNTSSVATTNTFPTSTGSIWLGEEALGYLAPFLGNMDEVAIWTSDQRANAATIYNSGVPSDLSQLATPPQHWWRMGDGDTFSTDWTFADNTGSYNLESINMEVGDRVTDVP
jgi:hypothetical protein